MIDTNATSAFNTETENFKINTFHIIMEANMDPVEWRREVDRVEKLLEIPEYPDFMEGSHSESSAVYHPQPINNFNLASGDDVIRKLSSLTNYFDKMLNNSKSIDNFKCLNDNIEQELRKINTFEKNISMNYMKDKVKSFF